jgi:hypothetical protein
VSGGSDAIPGHVATAARTASLGSAELDSTRIRAWHVGVVLALMAAQIACGALSSIASSDTNRDLFFAEQIATGSGFPLTGPEINGMLHHGPLWYYLLAIPLLVIPNAAAVTGFIGLLSSLQFPFAYLIGRRVATAREGLLFAVALALPGWTTTLLASTTTPIVVPTALLAGALAAVRYREHPDLAHAALLGLACVAMLIAHPTLVILAGALVLRSAARTPTRIEWLTHALVIGALLALSLSPMLYEQWRSGFGDADTALAYTHSEWSTPSLAKALTLIHAVLVYGPKYVTRFVLELPARPARLAVLVYDLVLLAAAVGLVLRLVREPSKRALIGVLIGLLVVQSMFVCAIRIGMPPWMVAAQWPLVAALVALGLGAICAIGPSARFLVGAALLTTTLVTLDVYVRFAEGPLEHADIKPTPPRSGFMNVRDYEKSMLHYRLPRIAFRDLFAIGDPLCEPVALYGHYAYLVDYTFAVSALARCGNTRDVQFGGMPTPGRRAIVGLHEDAWRALGMRPERWIGALGLSEPAAIWHSPVAFDAVIPRPTNLPRQLDRNVRRTTISGDAPADVAVLVSHRAHRYAPFEVVGARANGTPAAPVWVDETAAIFRAPASETGTVHWDIDVRAAPDYVDVLTFASH